MAPIQFQSHSCDHCRRLAIETDHSAGHSALAHGDMGADKIVFEFTFRDLTSAAKGGCSLCRWILNGEAVSWLDIGDEEWEAYGSAVSLVITAFDDDPDARHDSLLRAVVKDGRAGADDYVLVAATNPPFRNGIGYIPDILSTEYFGLLDPLTKLIRYRTLNGLQLFASADNASARELSTRPIENQPDGRLGEISSWLKDCRHHRTECRAMAASTEDAVNGTRTQPKRLIQIHHDQGSGRRSMRLHATETLQPLPPFAALSYCWGGDQPVKCLVSNLASLTAAISFDALPATIQASILVCERLGCCHLWIDALCIVQDDDEEKTVEIAKMPYIYGRAVFTIIATRAASHRKDSSGIGSHSQEDGVITLIDLPIPLEPIDDRGWTLQERALSTRTIEFGSRQTRWTCQEETVSSTDPLLRGFTDGWRAEAEPNRASFDPLSWSHVKERPYSSWACIIERYSRRSLTQSTDRPLAVSGIAERYGQRTGDKYIAGLWLSHLYAGLLSPVGAHLFDFRERFSAEVLSASAEPANHLAPFGAVRKDSGKLRVRGRLARVTYHRTDSLDPLVEDGWDVSKLIDHRIKVADDGDWRATTAELWLDCEEDVLGTGVSGAVAALELQGVRVGSVCSSDGLVLRPALTHDGMPLTSEDNVPVYHRLGMYEFLTEASESQADVDFWGPERDDEAEEFTFLGQAELSIIEIW